MVPVGFLQVIIIVLSPVLHVVLGRQIFRAMAFILSDGTAAPGRAACLCMGLLAHLTVSFFLLSLSIPWPAALLLPLLPLVFAAGEFRKAAAFPELSLNFLIWFAVVLALGASLFYAVNGIETPWANNYGDLAFHLGMITSFVFGDNFPPQYHIFPGERLSYPFMINLWSAALWHVLPSFKMLSLVFAFQWVLLWCMVFFLLNGNRYRMLPWALLFGGGSFSVFEQYSWTLIEKGHPWTVFLTSLWVTQRSALFGAVVVLASLQVLYQAIENRQGARPPAAQISFSALLLALSPLVHAHVCMVGTVFALGLIFGPLLGRLLQKIRFIRLVFGAHAPDDLAWFTRSAVIFTASLLPGVVFLPWLLGKRGMASFMYGWITGPAGDLDALHRLLAASQMWLTDALPVLLLVPALWLVTKKHLEFALLLMLFLLANFLKLVAWDWDQIKVFVSIYVIFLLVWSRQEKNAAYRLHYLCLLLALPGLIEAGRILLKGENFTVFSKEAVKQAEAIRKVTPPRSIIAAAPEHNGPVVLTGRKLFFGYNGTLWSHGLKYEQREALMSSLPALCSCRLQSLEKICPDYLLWRDAEQRYFKASRPCPGAKPTAYDFLYRLD